MTKFFTLRSMLQYSSGFGWLLALYPVSLTSMSTNLRPARFASAFRLPRLSFNLFDLIFSFDSFIFLRRTPDIVRADSCTP